MYSGDAGGPSSMESTYVQYNIYSDMWGCGVLFWGL